MRHRSRRTLVLGLCLVMTPLILGCPPREAAMEAVEALKEANKTQAEQNKKLRKHLALTYFQELKKRLDAEMQVKHQEARVEIYARSEKKVNSVVSAAKRKLETALEGSVAGLEQELEDARRLGDRAAEMESAVKLSAVLATLLLI